MLRKLLMPGLILVTLVANMSIAQSNEKNLAAWWQFESIENNAVSETAGESSSRIYGYQKLVEGAEGSGMLVDGYTTYIEHDKVNNVNMADGFTIEAWIAFQAYPWNWVGIVDKQADESSGYNLSVNANGYLRLQVVVDGKLQTVESSEKIDLLKWAHIAGSFNPENGLEIFINGKEVGSTEVTGSYTDAEDVSTWIGKSHIKYSPHLFIRMDVPASYSFDGLIDEVKIFNRSLSPADIAGNYSESKPENEFALKFRKLPAGPDGPGKFGAYYTKLKFDESWDSGWRVGEHADVIVRFDEASYKFVFWRGTSYIAHWVTETGIWYTNEFNETWGPDVMASAEPMSDKRTRQSHVRIIESNDARVVVHWRYALVDNLEVIAKTDPISGWGDWTDEYFVIYPDGIGTRKIHLWSAEPTSPHQFYESIILNPPGTRPEDNIEYEALTMMNMKGESHTYDWRDGAPENIDKPDNYNIQFVNLKSKSIPFVIVNEGKPSVTRWDVETEGPWIKAYKSEIIKDYSIFPWWNHWPVAQIPSDGRWASEPDRVAHTSLTNDLEWKESELTENTHVRVHMTGLTDRPKQEIVDLAKSWLYPPNLKVNDSFKYNKYDDYERAFILERTKSGDDDLEIEISANTESPLYNPAFIVKNWGDVDADLEINGEEMPEGKNFRYGLRHTLEGSDLIVWIKLQSSEPLSIKLSAD